MSKLDNTIASIYSLLSFEHQLLTEPSACPADARALLAAGLVETYDHHAPSHPLVSMRTHLRYRMTPLGRILLFAIGAPAGRAGELDEHTPTDNMAAIRDVCHQ